MIPLMSFQICDSYPPLVDNALPIPNKFPKKSYNSTIDQIFKTLKKIGAKRITNSEFKSDYYEWDCLSKSLEGQKCIWFLPYAYLAGIAKCGTTALCFKLSNYSDIQFYNKKEINIFSKHHPKDYFFEFENKIRKTKLSDGAKIWFDCSGGTFRDRNAIRALQKYSPNTKILFIVRDPWQKLGSLMTMYKRDNIYKHMYNKIVSSFSTKYYNSIDERFELTTIKKLSNGLIGEFMLSEQLYWWYHRIPQDKMLVFDSYDLEFHPRELLQRIERFLGLKHQNLTNDILFSTSHNTMTNVQNSVDSTNYVFKKNLQHKNEFNHTHDPIAQKRIQLYENSQSNNSSSIVQLQIHEPYRIENKKLREIVRNLFVGSLCLFQRLFGWSIKIRSNENVEEILQMIMAANTRNSSTSI
jgi:hypothetical protein